MNSKQASTAPSGPIKQYEVFRPSAFSSFTFEIRQHGQCILKTKKDSHAFRAPDVHVTLPSGQIVAAVALQSFSRNLLLYLGNNPDGTDKAQWTVLDCSGFTSGKYAFSHNGHNFCWTRTHQFSTFGSRDFKLVDQNTGQVLVVYRYNSSMFKHGRMAEIDYFVELGADLELMSLAGVLGIELSIQRKNNSSAAGAAGGGGGGGGG